jgi:hypothetical protein
MVTYRITFKASISQGAGSRVVSAHGQGPSPIRTFHTHVVDVATLGLASACCVCWSVLSSFLVFSLVRCCRPEDAPEVQHVRVCRLQDYFASIKSCGASASCLQPEGQALCITKGPAQ